MKEPTYHIVLLHRDPINTECFSEYKRVQANVLCIIHWRRTEAVIFYIRLGTINVNDAPVIFTDDKENNHIEEVKSNPSLSKLL